MKSIGVKAGARLLSYELLRADDISTIAKKLELGGNDFIHYFVRLRTGNEKPIATLHPCIGQNHSCHQCRLSECILL
ncbi:MAG: hypothetical protein ACLUD2_18025 [Clostridium sp.]